MKFAVSTPDAFHDELVKKSTEKHMSVSEYIRYAVTVLWDKEGGK